jgi:hypothetical protein
VIEPDRASRNNQPVALAPPSADDHGALDGWGAAGPSSAADARASTGRADGARLEAPAKLDTAAPASAAARPGGALYQQCELAAQRGDCVAVKRIVGRITATDRGYRARIAKGSPVAKCLAD